MKADDVLTDQMHIRGPVFIHELRLVIQIAKSRDIVRQSVDPDIHHMPRVKGYRNAPAEGGSGNAEILKAGLDKIVDHFILPGFRLNKIRMVFDVLK